MATQVLTDDGEYGTVAIVVEPWHRVVLTFHFDGQRRRWQYMSDVDAHRPLWQRWDGAEWQTVRTLTVDEFATWCDHADSELDA